MTMGVVWKSKAVCITFVEPKVTEALAAANDWLLKHTDFIVDNIVGFQQGAETYTLRLFGVYSGLSKAIRRTQQPSKW